MNVIDAAHHVQHFNEVIPAVTGASAQSEEPVLDLPIDLVTSINGVLGGIT